MKSCTRIIAIIARTTYQIEKEIFLFTGIAIVSSRFLEPKRMLKKSSSRGRTAGSNSSQNKNDCNRKEGDSHHVRSGQREGLNEPSSRACTLELQRRDPDVELSCVEILAEILRASSEIEWMKRGCGGVLLQ